LTIEADRIIMTVLSGWGWDMLVISAVSTLCILIIKELVSARERRTHPSNYLYIPIVPLIVLFAISAYQQISQMPTLYS